MKKPVLNSETLLVQKILILGYKKVTKLQKFGKAIIEAPAPAKKTMPTPVEPPTPLAKRVEKFRREQKAAEGGQLTIDDAMIVGSASAKEAVCDKNAAQTLSDQTKITRAQEKRRDMRLSVLERKRARRELVNAYREEKKQYKKEVRLRKAECKKLKTEYMIERKKHKHQKKENKQAVYEKVGVLEDFLKKVEEYIS